MAQDLPEITQEQSIERLSSLRFFDSFDPDILSQLASRIEWIVLEEGELLFEQDDSADAMYMIYSGTLEAYVDGRAGGRLVLNRMPPGALVGEIALLIGGKRNASVEAREHRIQNSALGILGRDVISLYDRGPSRDVNKQVRDEKREKEYKDDSDDDERNPQVY